MCHWCHILKKNSSAPNHRSENCRDVNNTYSKHHSIICKCGEKMIMHQNNGHEKPWLRCIKCDNTQNIKKK